MGNFTQIQGEYDQRIQPLINLYIQQQQINGRQLNQNDIENIKANELLKMRHDKLNDLFTKTNRNIICYYSAWLQGNIASPNPEVQIYDNDMNGFMNAVSGMDKTKGIDLILHTPGGVTTATESIVNYLRKIFNNDIRVIVPHMAMSAGTMIACAANKIIMGKESSLGPVDPQYHNVPAQGVLKEFERALNETISSPNRSLIWKEIIGQYRPTFVGECQNVIDLSKNLVEGWLKTGMFKKNKKKDMIVSKICNELLSHDVSKVHDRHFDYEKCKKIGLKVEQLEKDHDMQDKVLSIYHTYLLSVYLCPNMIKLIEGQNDSSFVINGKR